MRDPGELSRHHAAVRPDDTAFVFEGTSLAFGEFDARANRVANALAGMGLPPQSRVGYLARNTPVYYELLIGAAKSRHVTVGVNTRLARPEIEYILKDAGTRVLVVGREFYETAAGFAEALPDLDVVIAMDGEHPSWPSFSDWRDRHPADDPGVAVNPDDDFQQLYTSGTTGYPKGVRLTHRAWMRFASALLDDAWTDYHAGETTLLVAPVFHVAGSNTGLIAFRQGARCVMTPAIDPQEILAFIPKYGVQHLFLVPALIQVLVRQPNVGDFDYSSLKVISYGASPIAEALLEEAQAVFGCRFMQLYGLTENLGGGTWLPPEDHVPERGKLRSCGKPYGGSDVRIVDAEGRTLPAGEIGEICLKSSWLMKGYWQRRDATDETLRDGWLYTGDAGYLDEDGYLYIHDRIKDMIVTGGENVYPAEVENAIYGHPAVADVAVIGVPDDDWGEAVRAIIVKKPDADAGVADILGYARERIAGFKVPKSIEFVEELPRNPSGKILRRELREKYWTGKSRRVQ